MVNLLVEWEPNFKQTKQKLNYSEIWSLAISPEQKVITARDNNCMIYDMGKWEDTKVIQKWNISVFLIEDLSHCLDLDLNGLLTRPNFWRITGMLEN